MLHGSCSAVLPSDLPHRVFTQGRTCSSIGEEKAHNPRLTQSREDFVTLMANLGLPYPKQIDRALPANLEDGSKFPYA
jgi:hypothetical protein